VTLEDGKFFTETFFYDEDGFFTSVSMKAVLREEENSIFDN
jgi:hypothetical protein